MSGPIRLLFGSIFAIVFAILAIGIEVGVFSLFGWLFNWKIAPRGLGWIAFPVMAAISGWHLGQDAEKSMPALKGQMQSLWHSSTATTVVWLGVAVVVAMGLFPPWIVSGSFEGQAINANMGYSFITSPPNRFASVAVGQLLAQWVMVCIVVGGILFTLRKNSA